MADDSEETHPSVERRRHPRTPFRVPVIVVAENRIETLLARDLAPGGIYLIAHSAPPIGTRVRVEFDIGQHEHVSSLGTVVRDDTVAAGRSGSAPGERGFAIRFEPGGAERNRIGRALARC